MKGEKVKQPQEMIIPEDRMLSDNERSLIRWLLEHGLPGSEIYVPQIDRIRVVSKCGCGCASVDFSLDGVPLDRTTGLQELSDYCWGTSGRDLCGVFVFARNEKLSGIEVWSVDGLVTPTELPKIEDLREFS